MEYQQQYSTSKGNYSTLKEINSTSFKYYHLTLPQTPPPLQPPPAKKAPLKPPSIIVPLSKEVSSTPPAAKNPPLIALKLMKSLSLLKKASCPMSAPPGLPMSSPPGLPLTQ